MSERGDGEKVFDESLGLAEAVARRASEEFIAGLRIHAELTGGASHFEDTVDYRKLAIGHTALMLGLVEDPSMEVSDVAVVDSLMEDGLYEKALESIDRDGDTPITADHLRTAILGFVKARGGGVASDASARKLSRELLFARELASEQRVDVLTVFEDDRLFTVLEQRLNPQDEIIAGSRAALSSVSAEFFTDDMLNTIAQIMPEDLVTAEEREDFLAYIEAIKHDTTLLGDQAVRAIEESKESVRQLFVYKMVRTWGYGAIVGLAPEIKEELMPKMGFTEPIRALLF